MKFIILALATFLFSVTSHAQRNADFGIIGGGTFYLGDINQERPFYSPSYQFGALFRYNFDMRTSLRVKGVYANVKGSDTDFEKVIVGRTPNTFSTSLINIAALAEYNFFDYKTGLPGNDWTPYITGGIGYSVVLGSSSTNNVAANSHITIPLGAGLKVNLTRRLSAGAEWTFNKALTDRVDGVVPPTGENFFFKNDWYNFVGLFITYKFFKFAVDCPAYN